jgi:ADP-ribose pyrophosphatase YjhB (NUDIX family)
MGLVLAHVEGRPRPRCSGCDFVLYGNPASAAAGVVLDGGGRVLLIRRRIAPHLGDWALPAGYQEIDEDPRDTVRREILEETGLAVEVMRLFDVLFMPDDPRKPSNVIVFLCRAIGGELRAGSDASDVAWFALDDLPANIGFQNAPRILARLRDGGGWPEARP